LSELTVFLPLRTVSLTNQREHWSKRSKRANTHRNITAAKCRFAGADRLVPPLRVELVRCAPRRLDDDNLRGALKNVRDGVADAIGIDDGDPRIEWVYSQERACTVCTGVKVRISKRRGAA
jgi:hypothetical protein